MKRNLLVVSLFALALGGCSSMDGGSSSASGTYNQYNSSQNHTYASLTDQGNVSNNQAYAYSTNQQSAQPLDDAAITAKVKTNFINERLFGSRNITTMPIHVETINGIVYLSGTADSTRQARNALTLAKQVDGVKAVRSTVDVIQN
ncbi:MAG: BON domain-containing protein [Gammaproteobacteria bacterium]|nr:BON domain-containing protein [Gammaproteobacteria bacterium]